MQMYRKGSYTIYDIRYHIVWITKYCKPVMLGKVAGRCRELVRRACKENEVENIKGHVSKDHIHLFVSAIPTKRASKLVQLMKIGICRNSIGGQHLWARRYFVTSSGNIAGEMIREHIENQDVEKDDDFRISGS